MKRILVTGGAGFLGAHLCRRLLDDGHRVTCLDDLSTGAARETLVPLVEGRFEFIHDDVVNADANAYDEIYNLACPASPPQYQRNPIGTTMTSVLGAYTLLDIAKHTNCKILQASTSEIYGDPQVSPQPETYWGNVNPIGPRSCYDEGKRCAESLFFDYHRQHGVRVKIARIFNTYGPGMAVDDGRVVSNFICQALRGEPITIYGDGSQTRSFCYVDDMIDGLVKLMATGDAFTGPVNLGNTAEIAVATLAMNILVLTDSPSAMEFVPLPEDDPRQRKPDISLAREVLDWVPETLVTVGLERTIAYFRDKLAEAA